MFHLLIDTNHAVITMTIILEMGLARSSGKQDIRQVRKYEISLG